MVPQFVIGSTIVLLTEVISLGCGMSLYSKLLRPEIQGILVILVSCMVQLWDCVMCRVRSRCKEIFGVYWFYPGLSLGWSSFAA